MRSSDKKEGLKWGTKAFDFLDDFMDASFLLIPIYLLPVILSWGLGFNAQGKEIFIIVQGNFAALDLHLKVISYIGMILLLLGIVTYALSKGRALVVKKWGQESSIAHSYAVVLYATLFLFVLLKIIPWFAGLTLCFVYGLVVLKWATLKGWCGDRYNPSQYPIIIRLLFILFLASVLYILCDAGFFVELIFEYSMETAVSFLTILAVFFFTNTQVSSDLIKSINAPGQAGVSPLKKFLDSNTFIIIVLFLSCFFILLLVNSVLQHFFKLSEALYSLITGFLFLYFVIVEFYILHVVTRRPVIPFLLGIVLLFSWFRGVRNDAQVAIELIEPVRTSKQINQNFIQWLDERHNSSIDDTLTQNIYIIASEGGGIRSAYWTAGVLAKLDSIYPNFVHNTYGVSGVSGGSVGEMFFCALQKDRKYRAEWDNVLGRDYLSNALRGVLSRTILKYFVPFSSTYFDNARTLENDWAQVYESVTSEKTLFKSVSQLYSDTTVYVPNVFFNTTHVESGRKAIVSNLDLRNYFPNDVDLLSEIDQSIPLKTAGLLSARFPLISPPGLIKNCEGEPWGKLVDGGYYDNSGLLTAIDIVEMMRAVRPDSLSINPVIIFIRNNLITQSDEYAIASNTTAPVSAFVNSWTAKTERTARDVAYLSKELGFEFLQLQLDYYRGDDIEEYPLGWTLSDRTQQSIKEKIKQVGDLSNSQASLINHNTLKRLCELENCD